MAHAKREIEYGGEVLEIDADVSWSDFGSKPEIDVEVGINGDYERGQKVWDAMPGEDRVSVLNLLIDQVYMNAET